MILGSPDIGALVWGASFLVCIFFAVEILRSPRPEQSISAWLLLFLLLPPVGAGLYILLGRRKIRRRAQQKLLPHLAGWAPPDAQPISLFDSLVRSYGFPPAASDNVITFCGTGEAAYAAVIALIEQATTSLWISTYILSADPVGKDIMRRLAARAAAGEQVRLLVDDMGSPDARDRAFIAPLTEAGGMVARFMPISFFPRSRRYSNLRNHRKMIVADQSRVWSGGMNLSELYLGSPSIPGFFHDLSFVIEGSAAAVYGSIFAGDWAFCTQERLALARPDFRVAHAQGPGVVQVVPAGPEVVGDPVYDVILTMVHRAERRLWIASPYFVPDVGLMRALILAARRGVDIRFLTDFASDVPLIDFASIPYLRALTAAGGRVLRFTEGMIHAKAIVMDDTLAFAGTTNLDQRSLFLNFEVMALFYGPGEAAAIAAWMEPFFDRSTEKLPPATPLRQIAEGFIRLFAPVL
jgi:cardiolipin synthase